MQLRSLLTIASAAVIATAPAAASAQTEPESSSEATALDVAGVVTVSHTSADTRDAGSAEATTVAIGGEPVVGGSQEGAGEDSGSLADTGETPLGSVQVAPYSASVDEEENADASTSLAHVTVVDEETAYVDVLHSEAHARSDGSESETTGATVDLGGGSLHIELLHAETRSDGTGLSYVGSVNDNRILSSDQAGGGCEIPLDPIAHINCLYAEEIDGEDGLIGATAGVARIVGLDGALPADAFTSTATEVPTGDIAQPAAEPADTPTLGGGDVPPAAPDSLPRTGAGVGAWLIAGFASLLSGEGLRRRVT